MARRICDFPKCGRFRAGRGYCGGHYKQLMEGRDLKPLGRLSIPAGERIWSKVDDTSGVDGCWLWTAGLDSAGYGVAHRDGRAWKAHRLIYTEKVGPIPAGMDLDHKCHQPRCVNPRHLNPVSRKQNAENRVGPRRDSASGIRGVRRHGEKWEARTCHEGKYIYLGLFATSEEAEAAVISKRNELFTNNLLDRKAS